MTGMFNNCIKHQVMSHQEIPLHIEDMREKIDQLNIAPNGLILANGRCPFCIYELGYEEGKKAASE